MKMREGTTIYYRAIGTTSPVDSEEEHWLGDDCGGR